jgi:ribose transport system substrate-binding protein
MTKRLGLLLQKLALAVVCTFGLCAVDAANAEDTSKPGYYGAPRGWLWNPNFNNSVDTSRYKKVPPYVIGFSNASVSNAWRVAFTHGMLWAAGQHTDKIKHFLVTDANDDPTKQISDVQDLMNQGIDLLILSPATAEALDAIAGRAMKEGIPVITVDRNIKTPDNYVSFVTASNTAMGRIYAQWLVEKLNGKGNIVMLSGGAGSSPTEDRAQAAKEVFAKYPGIQVLDRQYTNVNPATGKSVMAAMIQKFGKTINGVWSDSALQASGAIEAFVEAGYKAGEIPPFTGGDIARMYQLSTQYKIPMVGIDYPTSISITSVETALDVLAGLPVPKNLEVNFQIVVSPGDDTASVKGDRRPLDHVSMDAPGDLSPSNGLPAGYDPRTFKPVYPK